MGYRENMATTRNLVSAMTDETDDPMELGFGQSVKMGFENFRAEDISTSESNAVERFYGARNSTLDQMLEAGEIPQGVYEENLTVTGFNRTNGMEQTTPDYHALAAWANENTGSQFDIDDSEMMETMRWERRNRERQLANGNLAGELVGFMGAAMTDPALLAVTAATLPLGPGVVSAKLFPSVVARTALVEGLVGMVSEVPIQAEVLDFKTRIDSPYGIEDALSNVLLAGAGGAVFGGGMAMAGKALSRGLDARAEDLLEVEGSSEIDRLAAEMSELEPTATVGQHLDSMVAAESQLNKPLDPSYEDKEVFFAKPAEGFEPSRYELSPEDRELMVPQEDGTERSLGEVADELEAGDEFDRKLESFNTCMLGGS